jgi:hypothetical protein
MPSAPRPGQTEMALAVARTIEEGGALVVEAGTGVGKTFAYLVPALLSASACCSPPPPRRCRTSCSAATCRGWRRRWACRCAPRLLKGRGSYLCAHRLDLARQDPSLPAIAPRRWPRSSAGRRPRAAATWRAGGPGRPLAGHPAGDVHARELPGLAVSQVPHLPRQPGAARGAGRRRGGDQPPPVLRRPRGARVGHGGTAAHRARRHLRRGAPAERNRRAVPRRAAGHRPAARRHARHARGRACSWRAGWSTGSSAPRRSSAPRATCGWWSAAAPPATACAGPATRPKASTRSPGPRPGCRGAGAGRRPRRAWPPSARSPRLRPPARARGHPGRTRARFGQDCAPGAVRWVDVGQNLRLIESPLDIAETVRTAC